MSDPRRKLPAVNALLADCEAAAVTDLAPRAVVVSAVRQTLSSGW